MGTMTYYSTTYLEILSTNKTFSTETVYPDENINADKIILQLPSTLHQMKVTHFQI
jgi:hypothetical protein